MPREPLSEQRMKELIERGRIQIKGGSTFGDNFHFFPEQLALAYMKNQLDLVYARVPDDIAENEKNRLEFTNDMDDMGLGLLGMYLAHLLQKISVDELQHFFDQQQELILNISYYKDSRRDFINNPSFQEAASLYNQDLENLAIALMQLGLNPFDFSRDESTAKS